MKKGKSAPNFKKADKLLTNITLFVMTNLEETSKKSDLASKPSAALWLLSALGALGRRNVSFILDLLFSDCLI